MHRFHTLPKLFHSDETDQPFVRCYDCGGALRDCEDGHVIQKAYARGETIMEIAICGDCHQKLQGSYSRESREALWNFYLDHADLSGRLKKFAELPVDDLTPWIGRCATCGVPGSEAGEYVTAAHCVEGDLVLGETPMMICGECSNKMMDLLSQASRDSYDRWMDHCVPSAPSTADDRPRVRVML